jgi:hypothetical protein
MFATDLRRRMPKPHTIWNLDEVYLKIDGRLVISQLDAGSGRCKGLRAWVPRKNPYGSRKDLALLWHVGWQNTQTLDELSQSIHSRSNKVQIELDPDLKEELSNLIKNQS